MFCLPFTGGSGLAQREEELVAARGLCDGAASCQHSVLDTEVLLLQNVVAVLSWLLLVAHLLRATPQPSALVP